MPIRTVFYAAVAGLVLVAGAAVAAAGESTSEPSPTPPPDAVTLRVVEDVDGDGVADEGEPGLPDWQLTAGCSDALFMLTTDADGTAVLAGPNCVRAERPHGWLPTGPIAVEAHAGETVTFLLHDLGAGVMEISGEAIDGGLPAAAATLAGTGAAAGCAHHFLEAGAVYSRLTMIVEGATTREGCVQEGAPYEVTFNGAGQGPFMFDTGGSESHDFVANGDSMRLYLVDVDGAMVIAVPSVFRFDCAVVVPVAGFVPPGTVRVFVLSHRAKTGCAEPGNTVFFTRDDANLNPPVAWEAGVPTFSPPLELVEPIIGPDTGTDTGEDIVPPDTGSGGLR